MHSGSVTHFPVAIKQKGGLQVEGRSFLWAQIWCLTDVTFISDLIVRVESASYKESFPDTCHNMQSLAILMETELLLVRGPFTELINSQPEIKTDIFYLFRSFLINKTIILSH